MRFLSKVMALILMAVYLLGNGFIYAQDSVQSVLVRSETVGSPFLARDDVVGKRIQQTIEAYLYAYEVDAFSKVSNYEVKEWSPALLQVRIRYAPDLNDEPNFLNIYFDPKTGNEIVFRNLFKQDDDLANLKRQFTQAFILEKQGLNEALVAAREGKTTEEQNSLLQRYGIDAQNATRVRDWINALNNDDLISLYCTPQMAVEGNLLIEFDSLRAPYSMTTTCQLKSENISKKDKDFNWTFQYQIPEADFLKALSSYGKCVLSTKQEGLARCTDDFSRKFVINHQENNKSGKIKYTNNEWMDFVVIDGGNIAVLFKQGVPQTKLLVDHDVSTTGRNVRFVDASAENHNNRILVLPVNIKNRQGYFDKAYWQERK